MCQRNEVGLSSVNSICLKVRKATAEEEQSCFESVVYASNTHMAVK